jgi:hypothetical protein
MFRLAARAVDGELGIVPSKHWPTKTGRLRLAISALFLPLNRLLHACVAVSLPVCVAAVPLRAEVQIAANMKDQMIYRFCSKAMAADFSKAGKQPPHGMVADTCGCVVQQIHARASIDQAKTICQAEARQKYTLQ